MKNNQNYRCVGLKYLLEQAKHDKVAAYDAALLLEQERCGASVAQRYYMRSAFMGYPPAMLALASLLMRGKYLQQDDSGEDYVTVQDTAMAVDWIKQAAKAGDPTAIYALARCCLEGREMQQSTVACQYYLDQIPFPEGGLNPYEVSEAQIFGDLCTELRKLIRKEISKKAVAAHS